MSPRSRHLSSSSAGASTNGASSFPSAVRRLRRVRGPRPAGASAGGGRPHGGGGIHLHQHGAVEHPERLEDDRIRKGLPFQRFFRLGYGVRLRAFFFRRCLQADGNGAAGRLFQRGEQEGPLVRLLQPIEEHLVAAGDDELLPPDLPLHLVQKAHQDDAFPLLRLDGPLHGVPQPGARRIPASRGFRVGRGRAREASAAAARRSGAAARWTGGRWETDAGAPPGPGLRPLRLEGRKGEQPLRVRQAQQQQLEPQVGILGPQDVPFGAEGDVEEEHPLLLRPPRGQVPHPFEGRRRIPEEELLLAGEGEHRRVPQDVDEGKVEVLQVGAAGPEGLETGQRGRRRPRGRRPRPGRWRPPCPPARACPRPSPP